MSVRFSLGVDLGTSNSAVAVDDFEGGRTAVVEITQLLGPNQIGEKPTLPSALYIPHPEEFPEEALRLRRSQLLGDQLAPQPARAADRNYR